MNFIRQQEQHDYNTRTKLNLRLPSVKRNWGKQRTAFHAIKDFNSLSQAIRQSVNLNIFKRNLFKFVIWMNFMPSRSLTPLARQSNSSWFWIFLNVIFLNLLFKWIWVNILYISIVFTYFRFLMSLRIVCILCFVYIFFILWDPFWKPYFIWKSRLNKDYYYDLLSSSICHLP